MILLAVVVERIAGNPLDVEQLADRQIGIPKRNTVGAGKRRQVAAGIRRVASRERKRTRKQVAAVVALITARQNKRMMLRQAGKRKATGGCEAVGGVRVRQHLMAVDHPKNLAPDGRKIASG